MLRYVLLVVVALLLIGCGREDDAKSSSPEVVSEEVTESPSSAQIGQQTYEQVCARCHAEGLDGAPKVGDRADWDGRSRLWEAGLFEHARQGFGEMPAMGGDETLDEAAVTHAAEYMMSLTYPDLPQG